MADDSQNSVSFSSDGGPVDSYTEITEQSFLSRILGSIVGVIFGLLLFLGSFALIYFNEGRVDASNIARTAVSLAPGSVDASANGKLVAVSGAVTADGVTGDGMFLKAGPYVAVQRKVEMYAWDEDSSTSSSNNVGGSSTSRTTYTYKREWTSHPTATSDFKVAQGHENPSLPFEGSLTRAKSAKVGAYGIDMSSIEMSDLKPLALSADKVALQSGASLAGNYVYVGKGSAQAPQVGDVRVSYATLDSGASATVFGKLDGSKITAYVDRTNTRLFRAFPGTREEAVGTLSSEYQTLTWILRAVGFLMMWIGLTMLFGPLTTLLDVLPILGSAGRALIGLVTFPLALVLSAATILV
jgi:uncharacterized membrane protein HdeD (DUF308 family)